MFWVIVVVGVVFGAATGLGLPAEAVTGSGSNGDVVFVMDRHGQHLAIVDSGGDVTVVASINGVSHPEWSPDGGRLAFAAPAAGPSTPDHIWLMDADGTDRVDITSGHGTVMQNFPSWSPDGTRIAFSARESDGCSNIWAMNADGSDPERLTGSSPSCVGAVFPEWSPDGKRIAFASSGDAGLDVWSMHPDGSDRMLLARNGATPSFSPDGTMIVFVRDSDLWIMNRNGGSEMQLTHLQGTTGDVSFPDWSPDGTRIAFELWWSTSDDFGIDIFSIGTDGTDLQRDTNLPTSYNYTPDWRPMTPTPQPPAATVGLVDPATGEWHLRNWAAAINIFYYGNPGDSPFVGDWDCDGVDTPGLYRQSDGYAYLRNSNSQGIADLTFFFGDPGDLPLAGDFNGDGCDTLSIYRPSEARFYIINKLGENEGGLGAAEYSFLFGNPGDKPVVGDWDRDGIDEIGLHRETTGFFYYRNTLTTGVADGQFYFGDPGDRFVSGDWGVVDGQDTPGVFRPSRRTFYLRHSLTQGIADSLVACPEAGPDWLPVSGQFRLGLPP
jgi:dipeptidyl aminopeptidase/acylaminoacyl peptidase